MIGAGKTKKSLTNDKSKKSKKLTVKQINNNIDNINNFMDIDNEKKTKHNNTIPNVKLLDKLYSLVRKDDSTVKNNNSIKPKISNSYYPSLTDKDFNAKIYHHPLFSKYKYPDVKILFANLLKSFETNIAMDDKYNVDIGKIFTLSPSQKFLRNFMSPYSIYNGVFIIHGTGVGKTCTGITITEQLKSVAKNNNKKIFVIRADEFKRQTFDIGPVKKGTPNVQCTGDAYLQNYDELVEKCESGMEQRCQELQKRVTNKIKQTYTFTSPRTWANRIMDIIQRKIKNLSGKAKDEAIKTVIDRLFSNSVLVLDEVHNLRDGSKDNEKIVPPVLRLVLKYSSNLKLVMLSATPMFDKPQNMISLLNYLLINDGRPELKEDEIFNRDGNLKKGAKDKLIEATRGYISYLRGNNPFDFPIRISARYNIPNKMLNLNKYPKKDIHGNKITTKINHLDLVDCPFQKYQKEIFEIYSKEGEKIFKKDNKIAKNNNNNIDDDDDVYDKIYGEGVDIEPSVAHSVELQMSNFIFQSLKESENNIKNCYGKDGFNNVFEKVGKGYTFKFRNENDHKKFTLPEIKNWGSKVGTIMENILKSNGPVFIYTFFKSSGVYPLAVALEMAGYRRYKMHQTPFLESKYKSKDYKGDYIIYTGDLKLSANVNKYLDKRQGMVNDKNVKVIIGSSKASEGLNLFGFKEVHIMDPWHNLSLIEQSIGRTIRKYSHHHLPPQDRNVSVYMYASTVGDKESFDLKIYKIAEGKAVNTSSVELIAKQNAIDCQHTMNLNFQDQKIYNKKIPVKTSHDKKVLIDLADQPYTKNCLYSKNCNYKCIGMENEKKFKDHYNNSLFSSDFDKDIDEYQNIIINILKKQFNINIVQLEKYLNIEEDIEKSIYYTSIENLVNSNKEFKDKNNKIGVAKLDGDFIRFIPIKSPQPNVSLQEQHMPIQKSTSSVEYTEYLLKKKQEIVEIEKKKTVDYKQILDSLIKTINDIEQGKNKFLAINIKATKYEIIDIYFNKLPYHIKKELIMEFIRKIYNTEGNKNLNNIEIILGNCILPYLITNSFSLIINKIKVKYYNNPFSESQLRMLMENNNMFGFIIQKHDKLQFYSYDDNTDKFDINSGVLKKIFENNKKQLSNYNKLYALLNYNDVNKSAVFKIIDIAQKGQKKSVTGFTCTTSTIQIIKKYIERIYKNIYTGLYNITYQKNILCNDLEILLKRKDSENESKWFYIAEHYKIFASPEK